MSALFGLAVRPSATPGVYELRAERADDVALAAAESEARAELFAAYRAMTLGNRELAMARARAAIGQLVLADSLDHDPATLREGA